jgi:hypothetical protein
MEQLISLALRQAQQAEVYEVHGESTLVHFEANRVKQIERRQSNNTALRLVRDGRMGFPSALRRVSPFPACSSGLRQTSTTSAWHPSGRPLSSASA